MGKVLNNFIDGNFVKSTPAYLDGVDPSTGATFYQLPSSTSAEVDLAVDAATAALKGWSSLGAEKRGEFLLKIADCLEKRLEEFALAESKDQGKPLTLARSVDIPRAVWNFRFFGRLVQANQASKQFENFRQIGKDGWQVTLREPVGVAGLISPWNLPLYLLTWKIAPCIAVLCEVFNEAGLPNGVINMVFGTGPLAGRALVQHPKVPLISFTGGTVTGKTIIRDSAERFKKLSLELGGKNANLIFADCDLSKCVQQTLRSSFSNQGEICLCGSRILVHKDIYHAFMEAFVKATLELKVGRPEDPDTNLGALVSEAHLNKVNSFVELAKAEGAKIWCGGERVQVSGGEGGYYFSPTIITGISKDSSVFQDEIFGPVVTVTPFETEEEAVDLANGVIYGLSATIWTENERLARRVASKLQVGTVWINCWMVRDLHMPFGGVKASGLGREGAEHSMDFFTEVKVVCML